eukprot:NODE_8087_length_249_cov_111.150000_g7472_i0.p2 GENE.NODE_8087_length_249_cov_111.150000_g7472_i0~~NODE_8087_length_249_cov_111.150000_g7472_i0.p2  ORF type:complete len:63 (-),score=19.28 NODE_8087_length_249_cov_111.150000_g7472_i0:61-225(-)
MGSAFKISDMSGAVNVTHHRGVGWFYALTETDPKYAELPHYFDAEVDALAKLNR